MRFDVVTLFPGMFAAVSEHGISRRALNDRLWSMKTWNPRDFAVDVHRTVDDRPYGGGPGMVMMAEPLACAVEAIRADGGGARVLLMAAAGAPLTDRRVRLLAAQREPLVLVCGRYEGVDQRFVEACVDEVVSIGDFVLSGGEIAAMAVIDAVVRQLPGAIAEGSAAAESFVDGLLDGPQYTRPEQWRQRKVPSMLLTGHHADIVRWRRRQSLAATRSMRPEMIERARTAGLLSAQDETDLREIAQNAGAAAGRQSQAQ